VKLFESKLAIGLFCSLTVIAGFLLAKYQDLTGPSREVENATVFNQPRALPEFSLLNHHGQAIGPSDLGGNWSVIFFGFSHCPDVCPTTMAMLARTRKILADAGETLSPQVYMISVDPERDTVEKLSTYVPFFHPSFIGITGSREQITMLTKTMGVAHNRVPLENGEYNIDHTSALFILNPDGHLVALSSSPHLPEVLANDLLALATK